jgi:hypothetical protein
MVASSRISSSVSPRIARARLKRSRWPPLIR